MPEWRGVDLAKAVDQAFGDSEETWTDARQLLLEAREPLSLEDWERIRDGLLRLAGPDAEG